MQEIAKEKQLAINLTSSVVVMLMDVAINFFLSPYIVKNIGVEANGYVQLANSFISYATLLVTVLNSMAGRFMTIEYHRGNIKKASVYYSSVYFADLILFALFIIPSVFCIYNLENIISIPAKMVLDVKLLFFFVFLNFLMGLVLPMWGTATYITNTLYITSIGNMLSKLLRLGAIIGLFVIFVPKVWYIGLTAFLMSVFLKVWNFVYKQKLLPDLKISRKFFDIKSVFELMSAGMWNAISSLGIMLINGLDLLICNLFIGTKEMGILSLAKTIPGILDTLSSTVTNVFAPSLTINYAKGNIIDLKKDLKTAMNITGIFLTIPLGGFFVFGDSFFSLWVPGQNIRLLYILSILTISGRIFTAGIQALFNVFVTVNKVKPNSLLLLLTGIVNTLIVFILVKNTTLGIFAVAGVSMVLNIIRNMAYTVPFTAKYLGLKWYTFFPQVIKSVVSCVVLIALGYIIKGIMPVGKSWSWFFLSCAFLGIIGFAVNCFIVLSKEERTILKIMIMKRLKKR